MRELYTFLQNLEISYEEVEHLPVYTVEEAQQIKAQINGTGCKNLFLTDRKKRRYLLVILEENKQADLKKIAVLPTVIQQMGEGQAEARIRLSFAEKEALWEVLHLSPGSVSPFGLLYDTENKVMVLLDRELYGKRLLFHPNVNTKTIAVSCEDLIRFIEKTEHIYDFL